MVIVHRKIFLLAGIVLLLFFAGGCKGPSPRASATLAPEIDLGTTIGSLVEVFSLESIPVEGYGLVAGLEGTGSVECPPAIRSYLQQYILSQVPEIDAEAFIGSLETAVVVVEGLMPAVSKHQYFDVRVTTLAGTQTTSLEGGWLYRSELKAAGGFGITVRALAEAEGPVFMDTISGGKSDKKTGYVLAGGTVLDEYNISLVVRQPDYRVTSLIRNRLNGRFGDGTAKAASPSRIELKVPAEYKQQKKRFVSIVRAMYLSESAESTKARIRKFVGGLVASDDKDSSEIALESIGNAGLSKLGALLNSSNEEVRLRSARCMLNLGSDEGLDTLRQIAMDGGSSYRLEALGAIAAAASRNDAAAISRSLLRDSDFEIRLAAYEQLRRLGDITIDQKLIARDFYLERIAQTEYKSIFVSRSGQPRIVLFGAPIYCKDNIFVQSADGDITINAPSGQEYVSIIRKYPRQADAGPVHLRSSYELSDIIEKLCEEPPKKAGQKKFGLGVSYAEAIALLERLWRKGAVSAEFHTGPLPKIDLIIK
jgi:flagellar basal body P-ring protein FlgI